MREWTQYVKRPATFQRPEMLNNDRLLCEHGLLTYDLELSQDYNDENGCNLLYENEWDTFSNL